MLLAQCDILYRFYEFIIIKCRAGSPHVHLHRVADLGVENKQVQKSNMLNAYLSHHNSVTRD